jgi:F-type H+-transporting ATPase subunit b
LITVSAYTSDQSHRACERIRKALATAALLVSIAISAPVVAQPAHQPEAPAAHQPEQAGHDAAGEHAEGGEHGGLFGGLVGPTINFIILCGVLYYFLKTPVLEYLQSRRTGISKDLVEAAALRTTATTQLAEIDRKIKALPGEIEALRTRGAEEIAAEEQRIAAQAAAERERLLDQTRREIDVQVRLAKRELLEHAADLSVQLATERLQHAITPADQDRLVDRYLGQLRPDEPAR